MIFLIFNDKIIKCVKGGFNMSKVITPKGYRPILNLKQTQHAIKKVKDFLERLRRQGLIKQNGGGNFYECELTDLADSHVANL